MQIIQSLLLFVVLTGFTANLLAQEGIALEDASALGDKREYQQLRLSLPDDYYEQERHKFIALSPDTTQVAVVGQDIRYQEEAESFARHRRHYVTFWSLFMFMLGVSHLWGE